MARKAIFITGAASGIGLATAKRFAKEGWFVGLSDIDEAGLERALVAVGPANAHVGVLDVRQRQGWDAALAAFVAASGGRLDLLMNNAGVARSGPLEHLSLEDIDLQLDINLKGVIYGAQAGLPHLKGTPGSQLINIASVAGIVGTAGMSIYAATKFAVRGLSESLGAEFAEHGVAVKCIMPWFLETPILDTGSRSNGVNIRDMIAARKHPIYPVEDAAEVIWRAAHSDKSEFTVGAMAGRIKFLKQYAPGMLRRRINSAGG